MKKLFPLFLVFCFYAMVIFNVEPVYALKAVSTTTGGGGGAPSGPAGGDLGGTYPNPTVLSIGDVTTGFLPVTNGGNTFNAVVTNAPYNASGFIIQTTTSGSVTSGTSNIPVVSSTGFNVGQIAIVALGGTAGTKNFAGFITAVPDSTHITLSTSTSVSGTNLPSSASSGTSGLTTTVPAGYTVYTIGWTTLTAGVSTGATVIPVGNSTSYKVGQGIYIANAGVGNINLVTTITAVSGNNITISPGIGNTSGGTSGNSVRHDDTAAIQTAMNLLSIAQNINVYFPDGYYQIEGGFAAGTGTAITIPNILYYNSGLTLWRPQATLMLSGNLPAPEEQSYVASSKVPHVSGAILATTQNTPNNPPPSIFAAFSSGSLNNISNVKFIVKNLTIRTSPSPSITAINAFNVESIEVSGVDIDTGDTGLTSQPFNNNGLNAAIIGPTGENGGNNVVDNVQVQGFYWGIEASEHTRLQHVRLDNIVFPLLLGSSNSAYGITAVDVEFNGCTHGIGVGGTTDFPIDFSLLNIEHQTVPTWVTTVDDISDGSNHLTGFVSIDTFAASITVANATKLHVVNAKAASYPLPTQVFADLSNSHYTGAANGTILYCSDCVVAAVCLGSGTGAFAKRLNAAWVCN